MYDSLIRNSIKKYNILSFKSKYKLCLFNCYFIALLVGQSRKFTSQRQIFLSILLCNKNVNKN